jgi:hypothetical protein
MATWVNDEKNDTGKLYQKRAWSEKGYWTAILWDFFKCKIADLLFCNLFSLVFVKDIELYFRYSGNTVLLQISILCYHCGTRGPMETASVTAQILIAIIPIAGIVMGSAVVFFYLLWNHRRKTLMIRQGMKSDFSFDLRTFSLLAGLLNIGVGFVLTVFFLAKVGMDYALLGGLIPLSIGISLTVFYFFHRYSGGR